MNLPNNLKLPNQKKKNSPIALILFGVVVIAFGIIMLSFNTDSFVKTTGKITEVREDPTTEPGETKQYDVDLIYTVDGNVYRGTFDGLNGEYKEGDDIEIYYDTKDPKRITNGKMSKVIPPIVIGVGGLITVFGIIRTVGKFR